MTLNDLLSTMADTCIYNIIHVRPNDTQAPDIFDSKRVKAQVKAFLLADLTARYAVDYANYYTFSEFLARYQRVVPESSKTEREQVQDLIDAMQWTSSDAALGHEMVWMSYATWKAMEDQLRVAEKEERAVNHELPGDDVPRYNQDHFNHIKGYEDGASYMDSDGKGSQWGEESEWGMKGLSDG
jgi:chitin synthase